MVFNLIFLYSVIVRATVHPLDGSYYLRTLDVAGPLEIERVYSSSRVGSGLFGRGWCTQLETKLIVKNAGLQIIHCGIGKVENFVLKNNVFTSELGLGRVVQKDKNTYTFVVANAKIQQFDHQGRLTRIYSRIQGPLDLVYEKNGELKKIIFSKDRAITITRGKKAIVFQNVNMQLKYHVQEGKLLTLEKQGEVISSYRYDKNKLVMNTAKRQVEEIVYNNDQRVSSVNIAGCTEKFNYSPSGHGLSVQSQKKCPNGVSNFSFLTAQKDHLLVHTEKHKKIKRFYEKNILTKLIDGADEWHYSYDQQQKLKMISVNGKQTIKYEYDSQLRPSSMKVGTSANKGFQEFYSFNQRGLASIQDSKDKVFFKSDTVGRVQTVKSGKYVWNLVYDSAGNIAGYQANGKKFVDTNTDRSASTAYLLELLNKKQGVEQL